MELDLFREGVLPQSGFGHQEQVPLDAFLDNRFGKLYESASAVVSEPALAIRSENECRASSAS